MTERHIVAMGGGGFADEADVPLDDFTLRLTGRRRPRVCFLPTATANVATYIVLFYSAFGGRSRASHLDLFVRGTADPRSILLDQDLIYVGGGNTANLLAIWRTHGVDSILREAWQAGVVLAGVSAGAICWFEGGTTDSFGPQLGPLTGALGILPGSFCPHYDGEATRRPAFHGQIHDGRLPDGWAADDGAALHFVGTELAEVVTARPEAAAYRVERRGDGVDERRLDVRHLAARRRRAGRIG